MWSVNILFVENIFFILQSSINYLRRESAMSFTESSIKNSAFEKFGMSKAVLVTWVGT